MTTGSRKQATGLLTARDDEVLERSLEKPVKNSHALLLGKGRRFNSGRPHHIKHTCKFHLTATLVSNLGRRQLVKKAPKLVILIIIIAVASLIFIEILQTHFLNNSTISNDSLVVAIVSVTHSVADVMRTFGYVGVFLLMLLDASSFPIPSEMILPFAGYLVFRGEMDFFIVTAVATLAGIFGSLIDYYLGMKGAHILKERRIIGRVLFSENQLRIAVDWFNKYGAGMVILSRVIPIFRTLISFPAGAVRMPVKKFIAYTALGSMAWNSLLIYVGYFLGTKWTDVVQMLNYLVIIVIIISAIMLLAYFIWRKRRIIKSKKP